MPELPEVETIRIQLEKFLTGREIIGVEVRSRKILADGEKNLPGGKIIGVRRFGKVVVIDFDNGYSALIHLKLTGQLVFQGPNLPGKHTHVIFDLDGGKKLYFNDLRKFGWIKIAKSEEVIADSFIGKLGPEPFVGQASSGQAPLTLEKFKEILAKSGRPIKILLMDQTKISGLGNIYANEALWLAGIDPRRAPKNLKTEEIKKLYDSIHSVLKKGIKYGGASDQAYIQPSGEEGKYQEHFLVYGREGEVCTGCKKTKIEKIKLGGRGTYWCPFCQV
ncbi:MAG: bifunctional DNA-formamidopyrimidine glycosylase/DNA-(apurinic or apyrimidinic site) lyase [bacterium]